MLCALAVVLSRLVEEPAPGGFLDSLRAVDVPLAAPSSGAGLTSGWAFSVDGRPVPIERVEPIGDPERPRIKPLTPNRVVLAGSFQGPLGGKDWDPDGECTQMDDLGQGRYQLDVSLPKGNYEFKVARGGSWNENYGRGFVRGGPNLSINVPKDERVRFLVDFTKKTLMDSVDDPASVPQPGPVESDPPRGDLKYKCARLVLAEPLKFGDLSLDLEVSRQGGPQGRVVARDVLDGDRFFEDVPLGSSWSPKATTFRVWSPVSRKVRVLLYDSASGGDPSPTSMSEDAHGVWTARIHGDQNAKFYTYEFDSYGVKREAPDIESKAASRDGQRSMVVDLAKTDPPKWQLHPLEKCEDPVDAVIYEASVRDFTSSRTSGVPKDMRGTYGGLVLSGTHLPSSETATGFDYLRALGVTHLHLLPCQSFLVGTPKEYTWGYATHLFNVPEPEYSRTPDDPAGVVREFKSMVSGIHRGGLRVVMDVVYNHTWPPSGPGSPFWACVPYYWFRTSLTGQLLNESGVGNSFDDERPMARKYVRDSLTYWQKEYGIDGFRFDLLGIFTPKTVAELSRALHRQDPSVLVYGEPWTGGGPTRFGKGAQKGLGVAVFNDNFRNLFRGDTDGSAPGFVQGGQVEANVLKDEVMGSLESFTTSPSESINYVSAHDNMTLLDRLAKPPGTSQDDQRKSLKFAQACVLLSQGVPFLEGGVELGRTKGGSANSYDAGDLVNGFDWSRADGYRDCSEDLKALIRLRKEEPLLRLRSASEVGRRIKCLVAQGDEAVLLLDGNGLKSGHRELEVVFNGSREARPVALSGSGWKLVYGTGTPSSVSCPALSAQVYAR